VKTCLAFFAVAALTACATADNRLGAGLDNYAGRPVSELFAVLGAPDAETAAAGQHIYVWGDPRLAVMTQMHTAAADTAGGASAAAKQYECTIRVFVGPDQRIASWDLLGNDAGCRAYAQRFESAR